PRLDLPSGDEDWFRVQASATGQLIVSAQLANVSGPATPLRLELRDKTGTIVSATGADVRNAAGDVTGEQVQVASNAGQVYLVRVFRADTGSGGAAAIPYSLGVQSLTADLGTRVAGDVTGTVTSGAEELYRVTVAAPGSLAVQLRDGANVQGNLTLKVL